MKKLYGSKFVRFLRLLFPIPRLSPFSSFKERFLIKNLHMYSWFIFSKLNVTGAKLVDLLQNDLAVLKLNKKSPLGERGSRLLLPRDEVIFEWVRRRGLWEWEEVKFLTTYASKFDQNSFVLVDIGGQAGLITRQILIQQVDKFKFAIIVEPVKRHIEAIQFNCNEWISKGFLSIFPFALDSTAGEKVIATDVKNSGNSSLVPSAMLNKDALFENIESRLVPDFEVVVVKEGSKYILKSDIQGMDLLVLSQLSVVFWKGVEAAVIEVWALPEIDARCVETLLQKWSHFTYISWSPIMKNNTTLVHVGDFWKSKSGATRNLFLHK